jgi:hypothetical protein
MLPEPIQPHKRKKENPKQPTTEGLARARSKKQNVGMVFVREQR